MTETHETIADIIAEMRRTKYYGEECTVKWCLTEWADRLEAAHERELAAGGNSAKLREALIKIRDLTEPCEGVTEVELIINDIAISALSAPPRNCDVGTADEQGERMRTFCLSHEGCHSCEFGTIPLLTLGQCVLEWAHTPYKAEQKGGVE